MMMMFHRRRASPKLRNGIIEAGSTCEAEYMAASEAAQEAVWMKEFITDLGVIPKCVGPDDSLL